LEGFKLTKELGTYGTFREHAHEKSPKQIVVATYWKDSIRQRKVPQIVYFGL
jgi:hypothetical protein